MGKADLLRSLWESAYFALQKWNNPALDPLPEIEEFRESRRAFQEIDWRSVLPSLWDRLAAAVGMIDETLNAMRSVDPPERRKNYRLPIHSHHVQMIREAEQAMRSIEMGARQSVENPAASGEAPERDELLCSSDFTCVNWRGNVYTFSTNQASCIKVMYEAWLRGTPVMTQATITGEADVFQNELRKVFEKSGKPHPAWNKLIISPEKGRYRLAEQSPKENPRSGKTGG